MKLLTFSTQKYEWGKIGNSSIVGLLASKADSNFILDEKLPYAELWLGTHPNGPSKIAENNQNLEEFIQKNKEVLGKDLICQFGENLPFLFKVLSVNKALSIQAHPNKKHAEELYKSRPDLYKDPNHKPELAIALGKFEALCGFRPIFEVVEFLKNIPELENLVGNENSKALDDSNKENQKEILKKCFTNFMTQNEKNVKKNLESLLKRLKSADEKTRQFQLADLIEKLENQFPGDIGCFSIYFLNKVSLEDGQSLYLGPNEPHAYLSGNCIECMACSDNVVRAGLTPKFKDVETLCDMLTYETGPPNEKLFCPIKEDCKSIVYAPPIPDFAVAKIFLKSGSYETKIRKSCSIILVLEGTGMAKDCQCAKEKILTQGKSYFVPANSKIQITNAENLTIYQAFANI